MLESTGYILGFDPGGTGNFGWSICREVHGLLRPPPITGLADNAWEALTQVRTAMPDNPTVLAAGIDALLFWNVRGNRQVDRIIRQALRDANFPGHLAGTPIAVGGLRGSVLVQGMLLAKFLWETWRLPITESYPTALRHLLQHPEQALIVDMAQQLIANLDDHERDATLCAVAAWAMSHHQDLPGWQNLYDQENDPVQPFDVPVSYWMPIP